MKASKAFTLSLGELNMPVIAEYQVGLALHKIYRQKEYKGEPEFTLLASKFWMRIKWRSLNKYSTNIHI